MIDPQTAERTFRQQRTHQSMRAPKNVGCLHGNGGQFVDIKKSSVVDLIERRSPVTKAISLLVEEPIHSIDRRRMVLFAVVAGDISLDMSTDRIAECSQIAKTTFDN